MARALELAQRAEGDVEPNPMVGAVVYRIEDDQPILLSEGWHERFGEPHAEVNAIAAFGEAGHAGNTQGVSLAVTLEPCAHHGKTPPCVEAILRAGIPRVVIAQRDPAPWVSGRGIEQLREQGVEVVLGVREEQARQLNEPFIKRVTTALPWTIAKWAQTLDGKIATHLGDSQWISGEESRRWVHRLRARVDAVLVGIGTALKDDPTLTARDVAVHRIARRVVIDPRLVLPIDSKLVRSLREGGPPITLATALESLDAAADRKAALEEAGAEIVPLGRHARSDRLDLRPLLAHLAEAHQATNVLVEGGGGVVGSMLAQGLLDALEVFVAPRVMGVSSASGGEAGARFGAGLGAAMTHPIPAVQWPVAAGAGPERIAEAQPLSLRGVTQRGEDVQLSYRVLSADAGQ